MAAIGLSCVGAAFGTSGPNDGLILALILGTPLLSLPLIRRRRAWAALALNASTFPLVFRVQDPSWRGFAAAMPLFSAVKGYDLARHMPQHPPTLHYAALLMLPNPCGAQRVAYAEVVTRNDVTELLCKALPGLGLGYAALTRTSHWFVRCTAAGVIGMMGLTALNTYYRLLFLLCRRRVECVMDAPWRATSLQEFWGRRWNRPIHATFHRVVFLPLRRAVPGTVAALGAFTASGTFHALLVAGMGGTAEQCAATAAFFLAQWALLGLERAFALRGWLWTAGSLAVTAPLFLHPILEINGI